MPGLRPEGVAQAAHDGRAVQVVTPSEVGAGKANEARVQKLRRQPDAGLVESADSRQRQWIGSSTIRKCSTGLPAQFAPNAECSERLQHQRVRHDERGSDPPSAMAHEAEYRLATNGDSS